MWFHDPVPTRAPEQMGRAGKLWLRSGCHWHSHYRQEPWQSMARFWFFSPFKAPGFFLLCMHLMFKLSKAQDISHLNILTCREIYSIAFGNNQQGYCMNLIEKYSGDIGVFDFSWSSFQIHKTYFCPLLNAIFTWTKGFCFILKNTSRLLYGNLSKSLVFAFEMTVTFLWAAGLGAGLLLGSRSHSRTSRAQTELLLPAGLLPTKRCGTAWELQGLVWKFIFPADPASSHSFSTLKIKIRQDVTLLLYLGKQR